jgi:hypothetical protein
VKTLQLTSLCFWKAFTEFNRSMVFVGRDGLLDKILKFPDQFARGLHTWSEDHICFNDQTALGIRYAKHGTFSDARVLRFRLSQLLELCGTGCTT